MKLDVTIGPDANPVLNGVQCYQNGPAQVQPVNLGPDVGSQQVTPATEHLGERDGDDHRGDGHEKFE